METWLPPIAVASIIGMLGWAIQSMLALRDKVTEVGTQLRRIISDIESEKGTRLRLHADFEQRLRVLERH